MNQSGENKSEPDPQLAWILDSNISTSSELRWFPPSASRVDPASSRGLDWMTPGGLFQPHFSPILWILLPLHQSKIKKMVIYEKKVWRSVRTVTNRPQTFSVTSYMVSENAFLTPPPQCMLPPGKRISHNRKLGVKKPVWYLANPVDTTLPLLPTKLVKHSSPCTWSWGRENKGQHQHERQALWVAGRLHQSSLPPDARIHYHSWEA